MTETIVYHEPCREQPATRWSYSHELQLAVDPHGCPMLDLLGVEWVDE
ncbi:hypothetical protein [Pseudonocardia spinosispora]|nr:hypothetical protein [Pseudonocardia spinosispora]